MKYLDEVSSFLTLLTLKLSADYMRDNCTKQPGDKKAAQMLWIYRAALKSWPERCFGISKAHRCIRSQWPISVKRDAPRTALSQVLPCKNLSICAPVSRDAWWPDTIKIWKHYKTYSSIGSSLTFAAATASTISAFSSSSSTQLLLLPAIDGVLL